MEAILKFDPIEESEAFQFAVDGHKWQSVVCDLDNVLRSKIKYEDGKITAEQMRQELRDLMEGYGLSL